MPLRMKAVASLFVAAVLSSSAWAINAALPGTVNYVEGQVSIGNQELNSKSIGSAELQPNQSIQTQKGMAEVLLTPGVFLRLGNDTLVEMISPSLTDTEVQVTKGHAIVEADRIYKANDVRVDEHDATIRLLKSGLYDFDGDHSQFRNFKGEALLREGGYHLKVKGGKEVNLVTNQEIKARGFKQEAYEGNLYRFSRLRSDYLAEANAQAARVYGANGWNGFGWWWDPSFGGYTFIPASGAFYSPFGWGFYSPEAPYPYWGWSWGWAGPHHIFPYYHHTPMLGYRRDLGVPRGSAFHHGPNVGALHGPGAVAPHVMNR